MNILDRFLCVVDIRKYQLQLLSCVCLLLACKLRKNDDFITIDKLVNYTDYSVTADEITVSTAFFDSFTFVCTFGYKVYLAFPTASPSLLFFRLELLFFRVLKGSNPVI